jgi:hypothetical protein
VKVAVAVGLVVTGIGGLVLARTTAPGADGSKVVVSTVASADLSGTTSGRRHPSIRTEVRLLDRAGIALSDGAPERALSVLREYDERFPQGELRQEAEILRMRAQGNERPEK